ncbi:phage tail protein [Streptomyces sp. DH37]|uniref:phage tail tube protein n=1 Tax=Streptomyces sp. DH37 TaxID=3040122 RepID=UPI0024435BDC|nr:phage tail protein [Streptomyces sp. DH37]MDG9703813.1 phage tail protein [Streptomyces sp. DH37]
MPAWETLKNHQNTLIRKSLEGSTFIAPITSDAITSLTGADSSLNALPAGYNDLGWMSDDGAQFSSDVETSDVTSWGAVEPTRRDIVSDVTTLQVSLQETNKHTIGLYTGADMTAVVPDATSGEVVVEKPDRPPLRYWRVLTIGVDLADAGEIYIARFLPRASLTDKDDQAFNNGDDPLGWPVTLTGYMDDTLGYSERFYFGGPGWEALLSAMGF